MKKTYVKPEVCFESFQLSANIATSCADPLMHSMLTCPPIPGMKIFLEPDACTDGTPEENGLCYQEATDTTRIFTS